MTHVESTNSQIDLTRRPRRNRKSPAIREILQETRLHPSELIAPLFVMEGGERVATCA